MATIAKAAPTARRAFPLACAMSRAKWEEHTSSTGDEFGASTSSMGRRFLPTRPAGVPMERTQRVSNYSFIGSIHTSNNKAPAAAPTASKAKKPLSDVPMSRGGLSPRSRQRLENFTFHSIDDSSAHGHQVKPQGVPLERTQRVSNYSSFSTAGIRCAPIPIPTSTVPKGAPKKSQFDAKYLDPIDIVRPLAARLTKMAQINDKKTMKSPQQSLSTSASWPTLMSAAKAQIDESPASFRSACLVPDMISIEDYLLRILDYCYVENAVLIALLVYFDRMEKLGKSLNSLYADEAGFVVDSYSVHRLVLTGMFVATKYFSDVHYTAARFAQAGKISVEELTELQLLFLGANNFEMGISAAEMKKYSDELFASTMPLPGPSIAELLAKPAIVAAEVSTRSASELVGGGKTGRAVVLDGTCGSIVKVALRAKDVFRRIRYGARNA